MDEQKRAQYLQFGTKMLADKLTFPEKFEKLLEDKEVVAHFLLCIPLYSRSVRLS